MIAGSAVYIKQALCHHKRKKEEGRQTVEKIKFVSYL